MSFAKVAALLLLAGTVAGGAPRAPRRIVLITIDTLRADALPGNPRMEALAQDSAVFTEAWSPAPWTLPALASILTGVSPQVHLATGLNGRVPGRLTTVAEAARRAGLRTAALVSSPVLGRGANLAQGFDEYSGEPASPPQLAGRAVRWLRAQKKSRGFFLWIHFYDPHSPYEAPPEYLDGLKAPPGLEVRLGTAELLAIRIRERDPAPAEREWIRRLYAAEVRWVDDAVGTLLAELKRLGMYEGSLIVLTSDHGEEFWEHGGIGHGHTLYEELLHVPLLVKLPGNTRRGEIDLPVSTASLAATFLDLAGAPLPARYPAAPSLRPLLQGGAAPPPFLATGLQRIEEQEALRFDRFKYIRRLTSGKDELYDLARDPGERRDLAASSLSTVDEAKRLLAGLTAESARARKALSIQKKEEIPLGSEERKRLRALGYGR